ncbi:MAG: ROK family protein [Gammaproteobacteria bacterium]|nr:ROK family protein [Gammaproteobacteria bacterium]
MLYKTIPTFKEYIWAGNKLKNKYNKITDLSKISESFEFSINPLGLSSIETNLKNLTLEEYFSYASAGKNLNSDAPNVLIKLIDSGDDLSIQVHPNDEYAKAHYDKFGKTEMWYIIDSDKELGGYIYLGFNDNYTKDEVKEALENGTILSLLNKIEVEKDDFYLIPSGTIHAIGKGVTLYEIQENSDLTFRLYDYDRVDKNGQKRELHIKEALDVISLEKYNVNRNKNAKVKTLYKVLTANKYFELLRLDVNDHFKIYNNENSFSLITVLHGNPKLNDFIAKPLESFYLDPETNVDVDGKTSLLIARVPKLFMGLDVGGTSIKGMVIDDIGNIVSRSKVSTEAKEGTDRIIANMVLSMNNLAKSLGAKVEEFKKVGIGFPGNVDSKNGIVVCSNNLGLHNSNLKEMIEKEVNVSVVIENDANCAALGEYKFTDKSKYHDMTLVTLGTGLGSGIIIDSKLFKGGLGTTTELGHIRIKSDNFMCTCGQYGCFESFTSLERIHHDTLKLQQDPSTGLKDLIKEDDPYVTIFYLADTNEAAKKYLFKYLNNLILGLVNVANILQPEIICLGGGVTNSIQKYIPYIEKRLNQLKYGGVDSPFIKVVKARLGNDAGGYGACALIME